ncbi:MAG TPA: CDP-alcohol phosphatidyltransferase family protein [Dongiaceae bacterium]
MGAEPQGTENKASSAIIVGDTDQAAFSLDQPARWRRAFGRAGIGDVRRESDSPPVEGTAVLVRADLILEEVLTKALVQSPDTLLYVERGAMKRPVAVHLPAARAAEGARLIGAAELPAGLPPDLLIVDPVGLGSSYNHALRKRAVPYALLLGEMPLRLIEWRMFKGAYKGVTDFVTKWLWPLPAVWVTRWCAAARISPNMVTAASFVLVLLALWLFTIGEFELGVIAAWLMTFLDTVDGKLARVTLTSSKWGNVFDHGIDLIHPPFWYFGWYLGIVQLGHGSTWQVIALWIVVAGYVLGRLQEGFFLWRFKVEIHAWQPLDSAFRLFTARRNPNLAIMTVAVIAGRADLGFLAVAVWTLLSLAFHFARIGQAMRLKARGEPVQSWLMERAKTA